ncbi:MAG: hypothetical protein ACT4OS_05450 [Acidimicrobiales bacterium]
MAPPYHTDLDRPATGQLHELLASWMGTRTAAYFVREHYGDAGFVADTLRQLAEEVEIGLTPSESESFEELNIELWRQELADEAVADRDPSDGHPLDDRAPLDLDRSIDNEITDREIDM